MARQPRRAFAHDDALRNQRTPVTAFLSEVPLGPEARRPVLVSMPAPQNDPQFLWVWARPLVWGGFCQGGAPKGPIHFSFLSFFVRPGSPFLRPDPRSRGVGARRSGQGWRVAPPARALVLDGFEHDGRLERVGMMTSEGSCREVHE